METGILEIACIHFEDKSEWEVMIENKIIRAEINDIRFWDYVKDRTLKFTYGTTIEAEFIKNKNHISIQKVKKMKLKYKDMKTSIEFEEEKIDE